MLNTMRFSPAGLMIAIVAVAIVGWAMTHRSDPEPGCRWEETVSGNGVVDRFNHFRVCDGEVVEQR